MIFHIAVCSPDPVLRGRVQRHCMEYYARRADACIVEQLESTAALLQQEKAGSRYELYLIELPAANPCSGLQAAAELRRRGVRAPLAFLAHTTAYAYEAFRVDAMQYLHIPFRPEQLTALLDRATEPEYGPVIPVTTAMACGPCPLRTSSIWSAPTMWCTTTLPAARTWPPFLCGCPFPRWQSPCWPMPVFCSPTAPMWSTLPPPPSSPPGSSGCAAVPVCPSPGGANPL